MPCPTGFSALARVVLKITGECFSSPSRTQFVVQEIAAASRAGCEIAVVVGGGNILRGRTFTRIDRIAADHAGMVATVVNGIVLEQLLNQAWPALHLSAFEIAGVVPRFSARRARSALAEKKILVLSGGTGNPLFSTDTAAALRAREIAAQAILKGTKVKGVYSADPKQSPNARFYPRLTYARALRQRLGIMDATAFALCAESRLPIVVFDLFRPGNLTRIVKGEPIGSRVC